MWRMDSTNTSRIVKPWMRTSMQSKCFSTVTEVVTGRWPIRRVPRVAQPNGIPI